jgi:hypothetical protein
LDTFAHRTKDELYDNDRLIRTFIDPLTDIQKTGRTPEWEGPPQAR